MHLQIISCLGTFYLRCAGLTRKTIAFEACHASGEINVFGNVLPGMCQPDQQVLVSAQQWQL